MTNIAVTGACGAIGRRLVAVLAGMGHRVLGIGRSEPRLASLAGLHKSFCDPHWPDRPEALAQALSGVELVVHLADDPDRRADHSRSADLARVVAGAAAYAGTRRMVFASSIYARLSGEGRSGAYGVGKREAEKVLAERRDLTSLVLRLPPVYGPGLQGGMTRLANMVVRGFPLPFATARAPRDYLWSENLTDLFARLAELADPEFESLARNIHEPSDGCPATTRDLIALLGEVLGRKPRLFPVPRAVLTGIAGPLGVGETLAAAFDPLLTSPQDELRRGTGWNPSSDLARNLAYLARPLI